MDPRRLPALGVHLVDYTFSFANDLSIVQWPHKVRQANIKIVDGQSVIYEPDTDRERSL